MVGAEALLQAFPGIQKFHLAREHVATGVPFVFSIAELDLTHPFFEQKGRMRSHKHCQGIGTSIRT